MIRSRRLWLWIAILIGVVVVLTLLAAGYYVFRALNARASLADYMLDHPDNTAAVAVTIDENGAWVEDENTLLYNADTPLVMASTMKTVILAAYASAVVDGALDPQEGVPVSAVERYFLPGTDGGAHALGLHSLGYEVKEDGFAADPSAQVTLDDLARIMIHYSGNAETDYLLSRLGPERIQTAQDAAGMTPIPIEYTVGVALALFNHEQAAYSLPPMQALVEEVNASGDRAAIDRLVDLYLHDEEWRAAQIAFLDSVKGLEVDTADVWAYQVTGSQLLPHGTARDYAHLMGLVATGRMISPEVSALMQEKLESIPADDPMRWLFYRRFGAKDGVTAGVLALVSYGEPRRGPLKGETRVVVVIVNECPLEDWARQVQYQGYYLLDASLANKGKVFQQFIE